MYSTQLLPFYCSIVLNYYIALVQYIVMEDVYMGHWISHNWICKTCSSPYSTEQNTDHLYFCWSWTENRVLMLNLMAPDNTMTTVHTAFT